MEASKDRTPELAPVGDVPRQAGCSRTQVVLGCIGVALFAIGVLMATLTARREWATPLEMPVAHQLAGPSVATEKPGSTGPGGAGLEVDSEGGISWVIRAVTKCRLIREPPSGEFPSRATSWPR